MLVWAFGWTSQESVLQAENLSLAHNVAQVAHCQAQGKIGSGFDVASALFGSQRYVRFRSADLNTIMEAYATYKEANMADAAPFLATLAELINSNWLVALQQRVALPPGITMILGECGKDMNTPTSVRKVLDWTKEHKDEWNDIFRAMDANNLALMHHLSQLTELSIKDASNYKDTISSCSVLPAAEWSLKVKNSDTLVHLLAAKACFSKQRELMKTLGNNAGTPVEPDEITLALDDTEKMNGVFATGAPGAGGYDAVFALVLGDNVVDEVEKAWNHRAELPMTCLLSRECSDGVLLVPEARASNRLSLCPFGLMCNGPAAIASNPLALTALGVAVVAVAAISVLRHLRVQKRK